MRCRPWSSFTWQSISTLLRIIESYLYEFMFPHSFSQNTASPLPAAVIVPWNIYASILEYLCCKQSLSYRLAPKLELIFLPTDSLYLIGLRISMRRFSSLAVLGSSSRVCGSRDTDRIILRATRAVVSVLWRWSDFQSDGRVDVG